MRSPSISSHSFKSCGSGTSSLRDEPGAERAESVAALALVPQAAAFDLKLAFGDVVRDAVAGDVVRARRLRSRTAPARR